MHPSEILGELRRQRPGTELRKSQTLEIVFFRNPLPRFHQVALHVANESDRPAKSERSQTEKIEHQLAQRGLRAGALSRF